ncbi:biliverdin-producing heme oxygenase [Neolewinella litorea]|uniref:Heme oxygenase n=1 Tax=Neolewinella litorea TaxID=2562452 RepID=A0A4V6S217_9BACT|nr:biliverdin-producing heme oxygenase [Neolewinella litorea]THH36353.1 hypothetical protein E4021_15715 [Neolewinella litorea]
MSDSNTLLTALRQSTRADHEALEELTLGEKIMDGSLTAAEYRRIIDWQRRSHLKLEPRVIGFRAGDYAYRPRFVAPAAPPQSETRKTDKATAVGILYVLEGASLGGSLIYRKLQGNASLASEAPFDFYREQAEWGLQQWRNFVAYLNGESFTTDATERAADAAREAFATFRREWIAVP